MGAGSIAGVCGKERNNEVAQIAKALQYYCTLIYILLQIYDVKSIYSVSLHAQWWARSWTRLL